MFGLLMQDNTPVDLRYRGMGYVPGGSYYQRRSMMQQRPMCPPGWGYSQTTRKCSLWTGAGLGYVPAGPYYPARRFRGYGIPPGQAARVPQYGDHTPGVPGVPESFGEDTHDPHFTYPGQGSVTPTSESNTGWTSQNTVDVIRDALDATGKIIGAVTSTGQTYYQGSCPPGSVNVPGRGCVRTSGGGGDMTGLLVAGAVGLGLLALVLSRRG